MKYDINSYSDVDVLTTTEEKDITLSNDSQSIIFQMFSKNIYSNPIGSVVREITSNCFDSHVEAGANAPVLIKKHQDNTTGTHYISFIDYGVGISPQRIDTIFSVMFSSTKRDSNDQIGAFGLGSKTPLAYKRKIGLGEAEYDNSYQIITVFNGIKYIYHIYEGKHTPRISKLHEEPTEERNGTEIQVPVLEKDISTFAKEMVRQLYYFENIIFEGFEDTYQHDTLTNDYLIIRGKNFLFRGDDYSNNMHVCLGKVAYPIDYDALDLHSSDYSLPIALKLEVGDIGVTVSRESLDYSETTIKMLKKKLEAAKNEIITLISKQYEDIVTLKEYFQVKHDFGKLVFPNNKSMYVGNLITQKDIDFSNFKYQFTKMPNDKQLFRFFFDAKTYGKKPRRRYGYYASRDGFEGGYETIVNKNNIVYVDGEFNRKMIKQSYLKSEFETYYIIKKRIISKWSRSDIADVFNVHLDDIVDDKGNTLPFVQELIDMQEEYFDIIRENGIDYDELEVPQEFIESRKRKNELSSELRKKTIPVKFIGGYSRDRVELGNLFDYNMPIFYGTTDDDYKLDEAVRLFKLLFDADAVVRRIDYRKNLKSDSDKKSIMFIQVSKNNTKYLKYCKNARHIKDFFTYMLPRKEDMILKYFQIYSVVEKYQGLADFYRKGFINKIDDNWGKKIEKINAFINTIPNNIRDSRIQHYRSELGQYFDFQKVKPTKEQKEFCEWVDEVEELQKKNTKTLSYFNLPWNAENLEEEQITILQLAMDLS